MEALRRFSVLIDRLSEAIGSLTAWLTLLMVLLGAFNAVGRYAGRFIGIDLASNAFIESQWYLFSLVFLLGASYTLKHNGHVRVDVFYARLTPRRRAALNLGGTLLLLLPFCVFVLVVSWPSVSNSVRIFEASPDPGGLPRWPIKAVILISFVLVILQGLSEAIKEWLFLRGAAAATENDLAPQGDLHAGV